MSAAEPVRPASGGELWLIEDDPILGAALSERLAIEGLRCRWLRNAGEALRASGRPTAIVSDIRLPDMHGGELMEALRERLQGHLPPVYFITAYAAIDDAIRLIKAGASDYLTKPVDIDALVARLRDHCLPGEHGDDAQAELAALGASPAMRAIAARLPTLARHPETPLLLTGESGVGKEVVARALHNLSARDAPFVALNCAAVAEGLAEAELFGHERGAFTGANRDRRGVFEMADGGTVLLDEVGDMPLAIQAKLLRALQERVTRRIGSERPRPFSARVVCATHHDLEQAVREGRFREDLLYRINVVVIHVPPLRERLEDIPWLAQHFLEQHAARFPEERRTLSPAAREALLAYSWPGNVRELRHVIERACIMSQSHELDPRDLALDPGPRAAPAATLAARIAAVEREYVVQCLEANGWRIGDTARALGISRKTLWARMRRLDIAPPGR